MELQVGGLYESYRKDIFLRHPSKLAWQLGKIGCRFVVLEKQGIGKQDWVWWHCYHDSIHYSVLAIIDRQHFVKLTLTVHGDAADFKLLCKGAKETNVH